MSQSRPKRKAPRSAFPPGKSGNPGGRSKASREAHRLLSTYVLEQTNGLLDVADRLLEVLRGELVITEQRVVVLSDGAGCGSSHQVVSIDVAPSHKDVLKAAELLQTMALGEPMKAAELRKLHEEEEATGKSSRVAALTDEQLHRLIDAVRTLPPDATPTKPGE